MLFGSARRGFRHFLRDRHGLPDLRTEALLEKHRKEMGDPRNTTALQSNKGFFKSFWQLSKPYWFSVDWQNKEEIKHKALSWAFLAASLGLTFYSVREVAVGFNDWNGEIGNFIQQSYNVVAKGEQATTEAWNKFGHFMQDLGILTTKMLVAGATNYKVAQLAVLRWRKWMTASYENRLLKYKNFYHMQYGKYSIDNFDQRIQEDPAKFADAAVEIVTDSFDAALSFATFSAILYGLSNEFNLATVGGPEIIIPKFMFTLVMAYAALGTVLTHYAGKSLEKWAQKQQAYEAMYRSDLINIREKAEQVALNNSENTQKGILTKSFNDLYQNFHRIINVKTGLLVMRVVYHRLAGAVPLVVTFPDVVAGKMQIGDIFKTIGAFSEVKNAMSWYVNNAPLIKQTKASMNRLIELEDVLTQLEKEHGERTQRSASNSPRTAHQPAL
ncbi:MAG: hypothetical protein MRY79_08565 [Alphaproteobacteria bacterium]|nr:hypothetical protein [Alphaproteobacteria bacterium]